MSVNAWVPFWSVKKPPTRLIVNAIASERIVTVEPFERRTSEVAAVAITRHVTASPVARGTI